ncbi:hypothetical protein KBTX_03425 [wastewater metagenome]|uniref:CRISPR-associated protein Cas6 C-terminal domain-containing protein n=2 Tax=unclassified sequences TaxID=12908 RepID=A0A5B8RDZ9_9ZZZZ|nr:CRISPR system precrRNA processing endoribonuclease RAMP protein Cas6 [Arhodomonas sp. KWT]QEA07080.1 hypothetical protein KBTEX_03425 [uncultured organism]
MLRLLPLRLTFEPEAAVRLPEYPGVLWRSAFGARLRRDACITGAASCDGCRVRQRCAYGAVFEPAPAPRAQGLAPRFRDPPRPYVISPVHGGGTHGAGQRLELDCILAQPALSHLKAAESALSRLELHGVPMRVADVRVRPPGGPDTVTHEPAVSAKGYGISTPPAPGKARIVLEHPLRLQHEGQPVGPERFTLERFAGALLRRISSLHDAVAEVPLEADYRTLVDHARDHVALRDVRLSWLDGERHSARQKRRVPIGGLIGCFTIAGELEPLWPWLWAGQWTHVGKGAVMGLGRYRVDHFGA